MPEPALAFHPLSNLFSLIEGAEFDALVADVRRHGVREPVVLQQGKILDGRNRYRAAREAGVHCPTRTFDGDDPLAYVISLNLKRRHLNESQRAMAAARLANLRQGARTDLQPSANFAKGWATRRRDHAQRLRAAAAIGKGGAARRRARARRRLQRHRLVKAAHSLVARDGPNF